MTGILVKIPRNIHTLWQVNFFVVVNLFVSIPSHTHTHTPFPGTLEKNSGERSAVLTFMKLEPNITYCRNWS
jgi:hypothetical protein